MKNAIFAQFQGSIFLKVYKITPRNVSYCEANLYVYKIIKNHWWQNNTFCCVGLAKMTRMRKRWKKNAIFAQFQASIILKVYKISPRNVSYCEANLYVYKIKKNHWWQNNTFCYVGLAKMTRMRNRWKNAIFAQFQASIILKVYKISPRNVSYCEANLYVYKIKKKITDGKIIAFAA